MKYVIFSFLTVWFCPSIFAQQVEKQICISTAIEKTYDVANDLLSKEQIAGFSFAIQKTGQKPKTINLGYADIASSRKVDQEHSFPVASVSKIFVSTVIIKLIENEELSFDTSIDSFFPEYPNGNKITIYQLLTHTSGIKAWRHSTMTADTPNSFPNCPRPHKYVEQMVPISDFEPGKNYNYSNTNYVLLAEIIEIITKRSFNDYLDHILFKPLALNQTFDDSSTNILKKVSGYEYDDNILSQVNIEAPFGAGSLFSNAEDLLTFMNALRLGQIISMDNFEKMISYGLLSNGKKSNTAPYYKSPQSSELWQEHGYGMGMELVKFNGHFMYFHSGLTIGGQAFLAYFPHNDITFSIVINTQGRFISDLEEIFRNASMIEH